MESLGSNIGENIINIELKLPYLTDSFEWDINNPDNQPEEFSALLVSDLGLKP
jgi:hypothetical protein